MISILMRSVGVVNDLLYLVITDKSSNLLDLEQLLIQLVITCYFYHYIVHKSTQQ